MSGSWRRTAGAALLASAVAAALVSSPGDAEATSGAQSFRLDNGLEVLVVEDRRAPIVTHFIGYRAGGADDPVGQSGVAHFVEHLMFKSAARLSAGPYSSRLARFGGGSNAVTGHDATLYHARVPKERLPLVMELEADRMTSLGITDEDVETEREVIQAERRSRIDSRPFGVLIERVDAALGGARYGRPSIGLAGEIATIGRTEAQAFYRRHYRPDNAFVVVAGDVSADEVRAMAAATYGRVKGGPASGNGGDGAQRATSPADPGGPVGERRIVVRDPRVSSATLYRAYRAPGYATAAPREAEAIELLAAILTIGRSSRLALKLLDGDPAAVAVDGGYLGVRRRGGQLSIYAVAAREQDLAAIERRLDDAIAEIAEAGVSAGELEDARRAHLARLVFRTDDQLLLAQRYAEGLGAGLTIDMIERDAERLAGVGPADIAAAARRHLDPVNAITGILAPAVPQRADAEAARATAGGKP